MSDTNFTKGPWEWGEKSHYGYFSLRSGSDYVISSEDNYGAPYMEVSDEDAHLIAAATELYEQLNNIVEAIFRGESGDNYLDEAQEALAKARGEV